MPMLKVDMALWVGVYTVGVGMALAGTMKILSSPEIGLQKK
jgi:hypothetical protein